MDTSVLLDTDALLGQTIKAYTLEEMIGQGGFGAVYRARQPSISREVAIKIILPQFTNHPDFVRRFEAEAQLVARLEHPHIVPLYDFWRDSSGAFLVMRYLRGGSLKDSLLREKWEPKAAVHLVRQLAAALKTAHNSGVIHRDLKPANVLLDEQKNAYLSDFGIAKDTTAAVLMPDEGKRQLLGSPAYAAPEGIKGGAITPRSDLYNFAVLIYEVLTGSHPFAGRKSPLAMLNAHINDPLPSLQNLRPELPEELDVVLQKATQKNPDHRYESIEEFERAFLRALRAESRPIILETLEITLEQLETELSPLPPLEVENPYKGLRAFQEADSKTFFGREALTAHLLDRLRSEELDGRFLAVVGASGGGKSSLVRAGLLPALRRGALPGADRWFYVDMLPGDHPLEELEAALLRVAVNPPPSLLEQLRENERGLLRAIKRALPSDDESELLLFIDQFEELFTLVTDPSERIYFLDSLYTALSDPHGRLRVVITLRADFYDRPLLHPKFSTLMRQCTEVVVPLTPEELERAIVAPAESVGVRLESGLVAAMVAEVSDEPGALPLLQYALTELFDRREDNIMKLSSYHAIGGALGALARRAEELYASLDERSQEAARQLFLRLVTLGEGTGDTRRRLPLTELPQLGVDSAKMEAVIELFGKYRLLTFDRDPLTRVGTLEVAHEAILHEWGRLKAWLDASREDIRQERRLAGLAAEWVAAGREPSFLLLGARLIELEKWAAAAPLALTSDERAFLDASLAARAEQETQEMVRQKRESRLQQQAQRRLQFLIGVVATTAFLIAIMFAFAFRQREAAQQERDNALFARQEAENARATLDANLQIAETQAALSGRQAEEVRSLSLVTSAQRALDQHDPDLAHALALEAARLPRPPAPVVGFLNELTTRPGTRRVFFHEFDETLVPVWRILLTPDERYLITSSGFAQQPNNTITLWDLQIGEPVRQLGEAQNDLMLGMAISPDGKTLLMGGFGDQTYHLYDLASGEERRQFAMEGNEFVLRLAISPDGKTFLSASADGILRLRDLETGRLLRRLVGHSGDITGVAYSPSGETALTASTDGSLILWDLQTGEMLRRFEVETGGINALAISPDGAYFLYGLDNGNVVYANLAEARVIHLLQAHSDTVLSLAFSIDGKFAISGGRDGRVVTWDLSRGAPRVMFEGHQAQVNDVVFSRDGNRVFSSDIEGQVRESEFANLGIEPRLPPLELINWLRNNRYIRPLTCEEQASFLLTTTEECEDTQPS